jgi:hypothetical protein
MGLKHQTVSDPALAKSHVAGERVTRIQQAEHARFGTISYDLRRLWILHHQMARSGYITLCSHHERVLRLPIQSTNARHLADTDKPDLTLMVYAAGTQTVINVVLTMQHFCQEMEACLDAELQESGTSERIKEAFKLAGIGDLLTERGYSALQEILERRDAVEHPKKANVFNSHPRDWDRVPLSWFLADRVLQAFVSWDELFTRARDQWMLHPVLAPKTLTFTVERGKKSARQAKKPLKE